MGAKKYHGFLASESIIKQIPRVGTRTQQGRKVPNPRDSQREPREQGRGRQEVHQRPDLCQLPHLFAEEELAERQVPVLEDHHGSPLQALLDWVLFAGAGWDEAGREIRRFCNRTTTPCFSKK